MQRERRSERRDGGRREASDEPDEADRFRLIVVVDGERTVQEVVQFERTPCTGEVISAAGRRVTIRHVIHARRSGLDGIVLAWPSDSGAN